MPKSKQQKQEEVALLAGLLRDMSSCVISSFVNVKIKDEQDLRNEIRELGASHRVVKKSMLKLALGELDLATDFIGKMQGNIALTIGQHDAILPVKAISKFANAHEMFQIETGFMCEDGKIQMLEKEQVAVLAELPSREELFAKLVGSISAPISGMVNVLSGNLRGLVQVLSEYQKSKV